MTGNKEPIPVTGDWTDKSRDSNDSESPIKGKEHASTDCSNGSAVNHTGESISGLTLANSVNNLNATDENNEHGEVNESKDGSGRGVKKEPGESGKMGTPSRSKNYDLVKSVEESISPLGTAKEHAKNAADNGKKCSLTGNKEPTPVTGDWMECADGTDKNHDFNNSQSPFMGMKHEFGESAKGSNVNCADGSISVISEMSGSMDVISFDNLNATGENNENSDVNESKDSSFREAIKKSLQKRPNKSDKKGTPSRSKNHDSVKSIEESTSPLGSAKEHAKNAADGEWECSLAKIRESIGNSGKSGVEGTPLIGTPKEHAEKEADDEWECSLAKI